MNPADRKREDRKREGAGRERGHAELDTGARQTPNTDMQDEDAGTAASGNESPGSAGKTQRETGGKR